MKLKKIERMIYENKMTPAQVYTKMLEHVDSLEKDSKHLTKKCNDGGEGVYWQKMGPCPVCFDHIKPCKCSIEKELLKVNGQLTKLCNMILILDVVICPEEIREDGMAILKETEFNKLFDYVHRDVCGIL